MNDFVLNWWLIVLFPVCVFRLTAWHSSKVSRKEERWTLLLFLSRSDGSQRGFHQPQHLKTPKSLGLFFFFFSFCLSSSGGRGEKTTHPTTRERNSLSSWTSSPVISSHKVSRIWERLLSFSKRPKRLTLEAFSVLNLKNKKKQKKEDAAEERGKELNSVLDWVFPSMLVEK